MLNQNDATNWPGWIVAAFGVVMAILSWFGKRELNRVDETLKDHTQQIGNLQQNRVTHEDFDELRSSLTATIVHGFERMEGQVEKRHQENKGDVEYIRARLDRVLDRGRA